MPGLEYVFSCDGLIIEPMLPHVIAACVKHLVIAYPKLKPFAECGAAPSPASPVDRARRIEDRITVAS